MIKLTRLNQQEYHLNCDLIETIEATPDTVITTVSGKKFVVREAVGDVVEKIIHFRIQTNHRPKIE